MSVGKPDAGNQHVRFDERGRETERALQSTATAPVLDSTLLGVLKGVLRELLNIGCPQPTGKPNSRLIQYDELIGPP